MIMYIFIQNIFLFLLVGSAIEDAVLIPFKFLHYRESENQYSVSK